MKRQIFLIGEDQHFGELEDISSIEGPAGQAVRLDSHPGRPDSACRHHQRRNARQQVGGVAKLRHHRARRIPGGPGENPQAGGKGIRDKARIQVPPQRRDQDDLVDHGLPTQVHPRPFQVLRLRVAPRPESDWANPTVEANMCQTGKFGVDFRQAPLQICNRESIEVPTPCARQATQADDGCGEVR